MKKFRIEKTRDGCDNEEFAIHTHDRHGRGLCPDEVMRCAAIILFTDHSFPISEFEHADDHIDDAISIEQISDTLWTVFSADGRFCSHLNDGEALYFLFHWILKLPLPWGGLRTYEEEVRRSFWLRKTPVALLGVAQ